MFTITLYTSVIIVHVASAALLLGGSVSGPLLRRMIRDAQTGPELGQWLTFGRRLSQANPIFALVLLATGIYLGTSGGWWRDAWFAMAAIIWMMDATMAIGGIQKSAQAIGQALGRARGQLTPEVEALRSAPTWDLALAGLRGNNLTMLYLMFQKPRLGEALTIFVAVNAVSFGAYLASRRSSGQPAVAVAGGVAPMTRA